MRNSVLHKSPKKQFKGSSTHDFERYQTWVDQINSLHFKMLKMFFLSNIPRQNIQIATQKFALLSSNAEILLRICKRVSNTKNNSKSQMLNLSEVKVD